MLPKPSYGSPRSLAEITETANSLCTRIVWDAVSSASALARCLANRNIGTLHGARQMRPWEAHGLLPVHLFVHIVRARARVCSLRDDCWKILRLLPRPQIRRHPQMNDTPATSRYYMPDLAAFHHCKHKLGTYPLFHQRRTLPGQQSSRCES